MFQYYKVPRKSGFFNPNSKEPFKISRSKIDLFLNCPRCFYLDLRLGVSRPPGFPFALNSAVDHLLKKEFDIHRAKGTAHPLMKTYGIEAVPLAHEKMDEWRDARHRGIAHLHRETNFIIFGGVDDVWLNKKGELIVVDYKSTAKNSEVSLDADWQIGYKRQVEIYQWLFRQNGFKVSDTAYFVYANGRLDKAAFDGRLEFEVKILAYTGKDDWVEKAIQAAQRCLTGSHLPSAGEDCDYCRYRQAVKNVLERKNA